MTTSAPSLLLVAGCLGIRLRLRRREPPAEPGSLGRRPGAMTRLPLSFLGLAAAVLLAACSTAAAPSPSPASASLDGHTYLSTGAQGVTLVPGTQIRLAFDDGNLTAQAGCNTMGGTYTVSGARITTTQMFMTEMGCDEPRMHQDEWLAQFLGEVTYTLEGDTLTLTNGPIQLTLLDEEVATPDPPLGGTRWILDGIISGNAVSGVPVGVTASIRISGDNVEVEAGCNQGGGTVEVAPGSLTFGPIGLTKMACEAGPMSVKSAVVTALSGGVEYAIDADGLTLTRGDAGLLFRAAP